MRFLSSLRCDFFIVRRDAAQGPLRTGRLSDRCSKRPLAPKPDMQPYFFVHTTPHHTRKPTTLNHARAQGQDPTYKTATHLYKPSGPLHSHHVQHNLRTGQHGLPAAVSTECGKAVAERQAPGSRSGAHRKRKPAVTPRARRRSVPHNQHEGTAWGSPCTSRRDISTTKSKHNAAAAYGTSHKTHHRRLVVPALHPSAAAALSFSLPSATTLLTGTR